MLDAPLREDGPVTAAVDLVTVVEIGYGHPALIPMDEGTAAVQQKARGDFCKDGGTWSLGGGLGHGECIRPPLADGEQGWALF